jgi:hypothetical protein
MQWAGEAKTLNTSEFSRRRHPPGQGQHHVARTTAFTLGSLITGLRFCRRRNLWKLHFGLRSLGVEVCDESINRPPAFVVHGHGRKTEHQQCRLPKSIDHIELLSSSLCNAAIWAKCAIAHALGMYALVNHAML